MGHYRQVHVGYEKLVNVWLHIGNDTRHVHIYYGTATGNDMIYPACGCRVAQKNDSEENFTTAQIYVHGDAKLARNNRDTYTEKCNNEVIFIGLQLHKNVPKNATYPPVPPK